jgi:hypothetical protein
MANDGSAGQPKPVSFIGQSSAPAADAVVAPMAESQAAEAEPLPLFLRRVRAPVLPGEEEEDDDERSDGEGGNDDDEWTDDEEDEDDLWCDYQECTAVSRPLRQCVIMSDCELTCVCVCGR